VCGRCEVGPRGGGCARLADRERPRVDGGDEVAVVADLDPPCIGTDGHPNSGQIALGGEHVEVDAGGRATHGVQGVDERLVAAAVERVHPPTIPADRARHRKTAHLLARCARIDHVPRVEAARAGVQRSHAVVEHVIARVLDQIQPATVRRDRVDRVATPVRRLRFHASLRGGVSTPHGLQSLPADPQPPCDPAERNYVPHARHDTTFSVIVQR
jgi:hypothetical protein